MIRFVRPSIHPRWIALAGSACLCAAASMAAEVTALRTATARSMDLDVNETGEVTLSDGSNVRLKLLSLDETRDPVRQAVREAKVKIELNGQPLVLTSATYHLPVRFGGVQMDCPITRGHVANSSEGNVWGLRKDARLRLWPGDSPWIEPGTFVYPLRQRLFATHTQMANEPAYVDGGEVPSAKSIYYHYGLDSGGAEGMVDVIAATAGRVISSGKEILPGYDDSPAKPRYDVVYLLDDRGWFYRYSHLQSIDPAMRPGARVALGQKVGVLGKEGGSGGWSHLHFDITRRQPSGLWGIEEGYAFLWEAYQRQYAPSLVAVARPHHLVFTGEKVVLDGSKSWSVSGQIARYDWTFTDGTSARGATAERTYSESGEYSEILKVTDLRGEVDYDFAVVLVIDKSAPDRLPPTIHPAFAPTMNVRAGDPVTFKVRSFRTTFNGESWDFGDGTPKVRVRSDGNVNEHAPDGYAVTQHRFAKAGQYLVRVERTNERGQRAIAHLHLRVEHRQIAGPQRKTAAATIPACENWGGVPLRLRLQNKSQGRARWPGKELLPTRSWATVVSHMIATTTPFQISDPINARILAISEDKIQGFQRDPWGAIARQSGLELETVLERVRAMLQAGTIRRVRQTLMATNLAPGALVAWQVPAEKLEAAFDYMFEQDPFSGHVVIRSADPATPGSNYRLWTTLKVPQGFSMRKHAEFLRRETGADHFRLMPAKRLFALGVGHVRRRGLEPGSRADVPADVMDVHVVQLSELEWRVLMALKREFEIDEIIADLWAPRAEEAGISLEEFFRVAEELNRRKVIGRFSTFLEHVKPLADGDRVTRFNALFHWAVPPGREIEAGREVGRHHILTHAYWREGGPEFRDVNIMAVAHGTDRQLMLQHKTAIDEHLRNVGMPVSYTNVFWGGRSEIKPSEISPFAYRDWCVKAGLDPRSMHDRD